MGQLNLEFLGTPKVRHASSLITFPTRKALALLVYLVVEEGCPLAREDHDSLLAREQRGVRSSDAAQHLAPPTGEPGRDRASPHPPTPGDGPRHPPL